MSFDFGWTSYFFYLRTLFHFNFIVFRLQAELAGKEKLNLHKVGNNLNVISIGPRIYQF